MSTAAAGIVLNCTTQGIADFSDIRVRGNPIEPNNALRIYLITGKTELSPIVPSDNTKHPRLVHVGDLTRQYRFIKDLVLKGKNTTTVLHLFVYELTNALGNRNQLRSATFARAREQRLRSDSFFSSLLKHPPLLEVKLSPFLLDLVFQVRAGLNNGRLPVLSCDGSGGVYFMPDASGTGIAGVFKPTDEEPMAINNPRGLPLSTDGEGLKRGTKVGEGAIREVAAYILDCGFAGVPPTVMVKCGHGKLRGKKGSLQKFVSSFSNCEDMGPASFPVWEVHKISVLDIRLANTDRNGGNILVCKEEGGRAESSALKLVPIDHGYCLPDKLEDCTFEWLNWPQARSPYLRETVQYIQTLDAEKDIALLRTHGWELSAGCACVLRISTALLKKGAAAGLSPFQIGSIMCRESPNQKSVLERMIDGILKKEATEEGFMEALFTTLDVYISELHSL